MVLLQAALYRGEAGYNMLGKHGTLKDAPAAVLGVIGKRWTLEDMVEMVAAYTARVEAEVGIKYDTDTKRQV